VLRISVIHDSDHAICFRLEGRLAGPWVEELRKLSERSLAQEKTLSLNLQGVLFVDRWGMALLRNLAARNVSHLSCSLFLKQQLEDVAE
jgi:ABC-type transporter Mla MlaB component